MSTPPRRLPRGMPSKSVELKRHSMVKMSRICPLFKSDQTKKSYYQCASLRTELIDINSKSDFTTSSLKTTSVRRQLLFTDSKEKFVPENDVNEGEWSLVLENDEVRNNIPSTPEPQTVTGNTIVNNAVHSISPQNTLDTFQNDTSSTSNVNRLLLDFLDKMEHLLHDETMDKEEIKMQLFKLKTIFTDSSYLLCSRKVKKPKETNKKGNKRKLVQNTIDNSDIATVSAVKKSTESDALKVGKNVLRRSSRFRVLPLPIGQRIVVDSEGNPTVESFLRDVVELNQHSLSYEKQCNAKESNCNVRNNARSHSGSRIKEKATNESGDSSISNINKKRKLYSAEQYMSTLNSPLED